MPEYRTKDLPFQNIYADPETTTEVGDKIVAILNEYADREFRQ